MLPLLDEYAAICRAEGDLRGLAEALLNGAAARFEIGDPAGGATAASEAEQLARGLGDPALLTRVLLARASASLGLGDWPAVERYAREADQLARAGEQWSAAAVALGLLGTARREQDDLAGAHAAHAEEATLADRAGNQVAAHQWGNQAIQLAYQSGDAARAERVWVVLAGAARALGDQAALQRALGEHALLMINRAQANPAAVDQALLAEAGALLAEQESICRASGDWTGLAQAVGNRAIVQRHTSDLTGALASLDEQLRLAQQTGNAQGVLIATANRGEVLGLLGRVPEALDALTWARQTAAQYRLMPMVQQLDQLIANLRRGG